MKKKFSLEKGFTLVEVSVVAAIFFALVGLATVNFFKFQHQSNLTGTVNSFLADMKEQQIKAMVGDTDGTASTSAFGVHFESSSYTLFRKSYGTNNFVISLPSNINIIATQSAVQVVFASGSGELASTTSATVTFKDSGDSSQKVVILNRYGVVTAVN